MNNRPSNSRYVPQVASKVKKPKHVVPVDKPTLVDMMYKFQEVIGDRPMKRRVWHEAFYGMSQKPESPKCIRELNFDLRGEYPYCRELDDMLLFIMALQTAPPSL